MALKAEVDKLDINNLVNVPTSLNNLKTKVDDLDVDMLKTGPTDLKKKKKMTKWTKKLLKTKNINTIKTKIHKLDEKITDATTLIHINQQNIVKQNWRKFTSDLQANLQNLQAKSKHKKLVNKSDTSNLIKNLA